MDKRIWGKTDLRVSPFTLGTGSYGSGIDKAISFRLLDMYEANGGVTIDTANYYGRISTLQQIPASEILIGEWIEMKKNRSDLVLCTKGACYEVNKPGRQRLRLQDISHDLHDSLKNLRTDYIDFYWIHQDDINQPVEGIIEILNRFVREGKIRYFGCSNWKISRILQANQYARENNLQGFSASQVMYNLAVPNQEALDALLQSYLDKEMYEFHCETGMPLAAYSSQAFGLFSVALKDDYYTNPKYNNCIRYFENDINKRRIIRCEQLAAQKGITPIQVNLAYLLSQPFQVLPIIGPLNEHELCECLDAWQMRLTEEEKKFLTE